jgi:hypothetical protein
MHVATRLIAAIIAALLLVAFAKESSYEASLDQEDVFSVSDNADVEGFTPPPPLCKEVSGKCVNGPKCPAGHTNVKAKCGKNQACCKPPKKENTCVSKKGKCVNGPKCPAGHTNVAATCGKNQACCKPPKKDNTCVSKKGKCVNGPKCPAGQTAVGADCGKGKSCCIGGKKEKCVKTGYYEGWCIAPGDVKVKCVGGKATIKGVCKGNFVCCAAKKKVHHDCKTPPPPDNAPPHQEPPHFEPPNNEPPHQAPPHNEPPHFEPPNHEPPPPHQHPPPPPPTPEPEDHNPPPPGPFVEVPDAPADFEVAGDAGAAGNVPTQDEVGLPPLPVEPVGDV